jgi:hypothetical protein
MKSIHDLEKRQDKFIGGLMKKLAAQVRAQAGSAPNIVDPLANIAQLEQRMTYNKGSKVNEAGNYTKPTMRKNLFKKIKASGKGGDPGQWSGRKAQMLAKQYKAKGGGYT